MKKELNLKNAFFSFIKNYFVGFCIILLVVITMIYQPRFLSASNLLNIIRQLGPLSIVSLGMSFVIFAGYLDLSVAGTISLVAVVTVSLIEPLGQMGAILAGIVIGTAAGALIGAVVLVVGANRKSEALFISYGMGMAYSALALMYSGGVTQKLGENQKIFEVIGKGGWGILSVSLVIFIVCLIILQILQSMTYIGRSVMLAGGNPVASRLSGIPVNAVVVLVYTLSGLLASIGSVVLVSRVTTASPVIGKTYETNAITAVLIGGTSLKGGNGSVMRTVLGVVLISLMSNCMNLLGISSYMQSVVRGLVLILAIWLDSKRNS
ncbi:ABC transporter permease [Lacrimispora sp. NSJ-141]|uniref:Autoinducer 2 import system permease protein LsrD n=1 Tax=Lientehia hominis TaxID=2897778 RepID=A0AAP2WAA3_9FIRM|nr:ABC transporter permease [Lientehia hominis]MCD2493032.1 ABC transporter permease [Lientehia hominis]